jgi:hypothetical protein
MSNLVMAALNGPTQAAALGHLGMIRLMIVSVTKVILRVLLGRTQCQR